MEPFIFASNEQNRGEGYLLGDDTAPMAFLQESFGYSFFCPPFFSSSFLLFFFSINPRWPRWRRRHGGFFPSSDPARASLRQINYSPTEPLPGPETLERIQKSHSSGHVRFSLSLSLFIFLCYYSFILTPAFIRSSVDGAESERTYTCANLLRAFHHQFSYHRPSSFFSQIQKLLLITNKYQQMRLALFAFLFPLK